MRNFWTKNNSIGVVVTLLFHAAIGLLLYLYAFEQIEPEGEEGVLVQVGTVDAAASGFESVKPTPTPSQQSESQPEIEPQPEPQPETTDPLITQNLEESVALEAKEQEERERQERLKREEEEERKRKEQQRKIEQANKLVAGAFSNSNQSTGNGTESGAGTQGSPEGNAQEGQPTGTGGYGEYDLGGRSISGSLPRPTYDTSNDFGTIVVAITVNPNGEVINALATLKGSSGTAYYNATLRASAERAAKSAVFKRISEAGNQSGTIIYHFKQR